MRSCVRAASAAIVLFGLIASRHARAEPAGPGATGRRVDVVHYTIDVRLDPVEHTLAGRQTLVWRNTTSQAAADLRFHLYLNAFKNTRSIFMRESGGTHRGNRMPDDGWGFIDVLAMRLPDGRDLLPAAEFIRPDGDAEADAQDETVLRVPLAEPVPPGGSITLEMPFEARLPSIFARTGYRNDFHMVAQWFPKIGVLQEDGWNCHSFHHNSEFFADFGRFDVTITVPRGWVIGATGRPQGEPVDNGDGTVSHRYAQDRVHDFAWTADPDFVKVVRWFRGAEQRDPEEEARVARALGLPPDSDELRLGDVEVTLLIQPERRDQIDRHVAAAFHAIRYFGLWYGAYPYDTLTVVDPAYGARGAGGMEYPTLITAGTAYFAPRLRQSPESVTIHEFGHQYWYGMVATNEFEEAFLDEGFNTYSTGLVLEKAYGPNYESIELAPGLPYLAAPLLEIPLSSAPGGRGPRPAGLHARLLDLLLLRPFGPSDSLALNTFRDLPFLNHVRYATIDQVTQQRRRYLGAPEADALARRSWEYLDNRVYGLNSYARTALVLRTLEGILGPDRMLRVMRDWFQRRQYRHPTLQDFIATVVEVAGPEADGRPIEEFLRQAFYGSDRMDYAAAELTVESDTQARGLIGPRGDRRLVTEDDTDTEESTETRRTRLLVRRFGGFAWPQTIELRLEGGRAERSVWDGGYRWMRLERDQPAAALVVDPDGAMALDANRSNNGRSVDRSALAWLKWWSRLLQHMQHVAYFYSGIP